MGPGLVIAGTLIELLVACLSPRLKQPKGVRDVFQQFMKQPPPPRVTLAARPILMVLGMILIGLGVTR